MNATTAAELHDLLAGQAALPYYDNGVNSLEHALQTAGRAIDAGADDELVLAAALHDIGRAPAVIARFGPGPHETVGAAFVRELVGERAGWLVGAHVAAKRALVAEDPLYANGLSAVSKRSLRAQGGPFSARETLAFRRHPWAAKAVLLRRWDDAAKMRGAPAPSVDDIIDIYRRCAGRSWE